jgi:hypothetical protein
MGYDYIRRSTTWVRILSIAQKFYTVDIKQFLKVAIGEGAWLKDIVQNTHYISAGKFSSGIIGTATAKPENPSAQVSMAPLTFHTAKWKMNIDWNIAEVEEALASNNWDKVKALLTALKEIWDLGIQDATFLGIPEKSMYGLLNLPNVTVDTETLQVSLLDMDPGQFNDFVGSILGIYNENSNGTALPDTFAIPLNVRLGLVKQVSPAYPISQGGRLAALKQAFAEATDNPNFKIPGVKYAEQRHNALLINKNRHMLYRNDPEVVRMDIPVPYTLAAPGTLNYFDYQECAYGQFSEVQNARPAEILYLDN